MILRCVVWLVGVWCFWVMAVAGIRMFADGTPPDHVMAVLPDATCTGAMPPSCWQGVQPLVTDYEVAQKQINNLAQSTPHPDQVDTWFYAAQADYVHEVMLLPQNSMVALSPSGVRLGDLVAAWGAPRYQVWQFMVSSQHIHNERILALYYPQYFIRVVVRLAPYERLSPHSTVRSVIYDDKLAPRPLNAADWNGFSLNVLLGS